MNTIDVRTEMRKLAASKPVYAAAGAGLVASETLRELPTRLAKWRGEASVNSLSNRANSYVTHARARAEREYDKLAKRGKKVLNARSTSHTRGALNGKQNQATQSHTRSTAAKA